MQPVGAVLEAPAEPAGAFVEAADQDQQVVSGGIDAGGEADESAVEVVDGAVPLAAGIDIGTEIRAHFGTSLWLEWSCEYIQFSGVNQLK